MNNFTIEQLIEDFVKPFEDARFDYSWSRETYYFTPKGFSHDIELWAGTPQLSLALKYCPRFKEFYEKCEKENYEHYKKNH